MSANGIYLHVWTLEGKSQVGKVPANRTDNFSDATGPDMSCTYEYQIQSHAHVPDTRKFGDFMRQAPAQATKFYVIFHRWFLRGLDVDFEAFQIQ